SIFGGKGTPGDLYYDTSTGQYYILKVQQFMHTVRRLVIDLHNYLA
ncbi:serine protease, partial [Escherichia coli]|nr:serine protease [Escherichia coli]